MLRDKKDKELTQLIAAAQNGDEQCFADIVRRFQQFAYATARSLLSDSGAAEDAVQEAFLTAYYQLPKLKAAGAFPAWLHSIVSYSCHRILRRHNIRQVPLGWEHEQIAAETTPEQEMERKQTEQLVMHALDEIPDEQREIVFLSYLGEQSQKEVASFLGIPKTTVNNQLHAARKRLKRRILRMVEETVKGRRLPDDFAENVARIVRVEGAIAEAQVKSAAAVPLFGRWAPSSKSGSSQPILTLIQRDVNGRIRLICEEGQGPARAGSKISAEDVSDLPNFTDDLVNQAIGAISPTETSKPGVLETGIKIIDLMAPLPARGAIGLFGLQGVGRAVLVMELYHRLQKRKGQLAIFYFATGQEAPNLRAVIEREPNFPADGSGPLQTAWLISAKATDPEYANSLGRLDAAIYFSPLLSCQDRYPPIDCLLSQSKLLTGDTVRKNHVETAERVRFSLKKARELTHDPKFCELVANGAYAAARERAQKMSAGVPDNLDPAVRLDVSRARKLELFFTQPFFSAERFTGQKGCHVSLSDTIAGCRAILAGEVDEIPEDRFGFVGSLDEVRE